MKNKAQYLQNEEIWWRMGAELSFVRQLLIKIQCDREYQGIATGTIFGPLEQLEHRVDRVQDNMERRMFTKTDFGNITAFYPPRESLEVIEEAVEQTRKELSTLGKRFMVKENEGYKDASLDEAIQNAINVMERAQAALDAEETREKPP